MQHLPLQGIVYRYTQVWGLSENIASVKLVSIRIMQSGGPIECRLVSRSISFERGEKRWQRNFVQRGND